MLLESVKFSEFAGTEQEWTLERLSLGTRNLIVGKNASGKTRTLNVINALAGIFAGSRSPGLSAKYDVAFVRDDKRLRDELEYEQGQVIKERFSKEDNVLLNRGKEGEGRIWTEEVQDMTRFQAPPSQFAVVVRRDSIQHKFLEPLYAWGSSLRIYRFGTPLGKDHFPVFVEDKNVKLDEHDPNQVVAIYRQAVSELGQDFKTAVRSDMATLDYDIEDMGVERPVSIRFPTKLGEPVGLYVKEKDLPGITDQHSMSQGMFRALSLLVQMNYSQMADKAACILIDDIGEGLDFDRSCRLIDLLRKKAEESHIQLVLSTNDRFVMNKVPLEEWSFLERHGGRVEVHNYDNSREVFEEFKFTGLSNFSFLEMDFISGTPGEETPAYE